LLIYQVLKAQIGSLFVGILQSFKLVFAQRDGVLDLGRLLIFFILFGRFIVDMQMDFDRVKVQLSSMENVVDFISEEFDLFLKLYNVHLESIMQKMFFNKM
jgi:hypothetical protein